MRILIVEDEIALAAVLTEILRKNNYSVDAVHDGVDGLDYALSGVYDAILLDIMLPRMDGLQMLRKLRSNGDSTPVLLLTAKSEIEDKVKGLDVGADDYITKPFNTEELLARVRSAVRRKDTFISEGKSFADITIDSNTLKISTKEDEIKASLKEYQILEMMIANPDRIISKEQFVEKIWGYDFEGEYNSVEVYISFVRKKLSAIGSDVRIKAHRGIGYSLEVRDD
ncbi:MAG: DNA-binding response regulator [Clostridiales bacterium]|nr:MAG: DNA-binding response regulator [Clostridiales bacterium]